MRASILASLTLLSGILACSGGPMEGTGASASSSDTDTGTGTETGTTSSSTSSTSGSSSSSSSSSGSACTPGMEVACACPDGTMSTQLCNPDGASFGPCDCPMTSTSSSTTDMTTATTDVSTTDASTTDASTTDMTTTDGTTDGTTGGAACGMTYQIELMPADATLSGGWMLAMSMLGEGEIANNQMGAMGSILFEPEIPCDDTWYIWARALDNGADDSYFATLDGQPNPAAIFEGDCTNGGMGYKWARLNWRDPMAGPCEYVMDPWAPMWTAGVHAIEFSYRESPAMGRILITNDMNYVPM